MQEASELTIGYQFRDRFNVPLDVTKATEILLRWKSPDDVILDKTRSSGAVEYVATGTDGNMKYTFTLEEAVDGEWEVAGRLTFGSNVFWSDTRTFWLLQNLPSS